MLFPWYNATIIVDSIVTGRTVIGRLHMISYAKLWRLLDRRCIQLKMLCTLAGISPTTLRVLQKNQPVRMDVLQRVCESLNVDVGDICSFRR